MNWKEYFEMMADWKRLPAYRAEPRIDSLIGYFLPQLATDYFKDQIVGIIPELPIRLATVKPRHEKTDYADRSYKVDFYLLGASGINYFVEFKTDSGSRRKKQDTYLSEAQSVGMAGIVDGIRRIYRVSSYKHKYDHLLNKLSRIGILDETGQFSGSSSEIRIVFVQPNNRLGDQNCIDFQWISKWLERRSVQEGFESHLASALMNWSND